MFSGIRVMRANKWSEGTYLFFPLPEEPASLRELNIDRSVDANARTVSAAERVFWTRCSHFTRTGMRVPSSNLRMNTKSGPTVCEGKQKTARLGFFNQFRVSISEEGDEPKRYTGFDSERMSIGLLTFLLLSSQYTTTNCASRSLRSVVVVNSKIVSRRVGDLNARANW